MPGFSFVHFEAGVPASLQLGLPELARFPCSKVDSFRDLRVKLGVLELEGDLEIISQMTGVSDSCTMLLRALVTILQRASAPFY